MGAQSSKSGGDGPSVEVEGNEKGIYAPRGGPNSSVQISPSLISYLSDSSTSTQPSPDRQSHLDTHIRSKISEELERLRRDEEQVRGEIEKALEKENLDREGGGGGKESGGLKNSVILERDLEGIRKKVERFEKKKDLESNLPDVAEKRKEVVACYQNNPKTPLDCWKEAESFRDAVRHVEADYLNSLR